MTDQEYDEQTHPEEYELLEERGDRGGAIEEVEGEREESLPTE